MNVNRIASAVFALLLVTAGVAGPATQNVAAAHECSELERFVNFATYGVVNSECGGDPTAHAIEDMKESDANQTHGDIYTAAVDQSATVDNAAAQTDNYLNDTRSVAWMKAESAVARAYENGATKSTAKVKAKEAIADYYATKQKNLVNRWNSSATSLVYLRNTADMEGLDVRAGESNPAMIYLDSNDIYQMGLTGETANQSVEMVNGNSTGIVAIQVDEYGSAYLNAPYYTHPLNRIQDTTSNNNVDFYSFRVKPPDSSSSDEIEYANTNTIKQRWDRIESQTSELQTEADAFVEATWTDFEAGAINSSDVLNANTQMFEYGTDGSMYESVAAVSSMGLDTPDINGTGTMTVTDVTTGVTYDGLVMAREAPNGSWEANTTYNASNIGGPVFMVTTDGKKVDFSGQFTVGTISDTEGNPMQNVTAEKTTYVTSNTSELNAKVDRLLEFRQEVEDKEPSGGAGGGSGGMSQNAILTLLAVAAAAALVYGRQNGGNGGGRRGRR